MHNTRAHTSNTPYPLPFVPIQLYDRMLSSLWALLRNVLATTPSPDDPDYFVLSEASDASALEADDELFVKSMRFGLGRLLPGELDVAALAFAGRPLQNLELCDAQPARLSIATLPLLALQVCMCVLVCARAYLLGCEPCVRLWGLDGEMSSHLGARFCSFSKGSSHALFPR